MPKESEIKENAKLKKIKHNKLALVVLHIQGVQLRKKRALHRRSGGTLLCNYRALPR
jgi:hypothetical protein